jgi:hypothetical protein
MQLRVDPGGGVRCLFTEAIDLHGLGAATIRRASRVDPDVEGKWWAELSPIGGPTLGPFALRSEALDAERQWLEVHWLDAPSTCPPRPQ